MSEALVKRPMQQTPEEPGAQEERKIDDEYLDRFISELKKVLEDSK